MRYNNQLVVIVLLVFSQNIIIARTCKVMKVPTAEELVSEAYAIVRAKAVNYEKAPDNSSRPTNGSPTSVISFNVEEIVKGNKMIPKQLLISGYLSPNDDFNDHLPPYNLVRSNGRSGSCFANTYKQNGNFLLFLNDKYTPYWSALAPVNEQLHSPLLNDQWMQWVKTRVASSNNRQNTNQFLVNGANKL